MGNKKCDICKEEFATVQGLASHRRHRHESEEQNGESLNLKKDFTSMLRNCGVRRGRAKTIADIYFDSDATSLENLSRILSISGVGNPSKNLIKMRWGQRIGQPIQGERLLPIQDREATTERLSNMYNKMIETEMQELLIADLRGKIERKKEPEEIENEGLMDALYQTLLELRVQNRRERTHLSHQEEMIKADPEGFYRQPPVDCLNCHEIFPMPRIPINYRFFCPRCGTRFYRYR